MAYFYISDAILFKFGLFLRNSTCVWPTDQLTDRWTDQWMDQQMDTPFYRDARTHLKTRKRAEWRQSANSRSTETMSSHASKIAVSWYLVDWILDEGHFTEVSGIPCRLFYGRVSNLMEVLGILRTFKPFYSDNHNTMQKAYSTFHEKKVKTGGTHILYYNYSIKEYYVYKFMMI